METQKSNRRILIGLFIIVVGLMILLRNFNIIPDFFSDIIFTWQTLVIGIGLLMLTNPSNRTSGLIVIAVGGFFWLEEIFDFVDFWEIFVPAMVILVGILMVFRHKIDRHDYRGGSDSDPSGSDYIDDVSIFGGGEKLVDTPNFKGGRVTAIFGGSNINLLGCDLASSVNVIDVFTVFGGSTFIVPEDWQVKMDVISIFGGFADKRSNSLSPRYENDKVLVIKGIVIFGGGEIKSIRTRK